MPSSLKRAAAFFGPMPGMRTIASTPPGISDRSSSSIADRAGFEQLFDFLGQVFADAVDVGEVRVRIGGHVGQRLGEIGDPPGRVAIGAHAKRVGVLELEQVGDFVESGGDVAVVHAAIL